MIDEATLFNHIMTSIWNDSDRDMLDALPRAAVACAAWVKTHKWVNPENALEVVDLLFPDAKLEFFGPYLNDMGDDHSRRWASGVMCSITFADASKALVECPRGIGSSVELP